MNLYRAVRQVELDDIHQSGGRFRDSPHLSGEKPFFFTLESALAFAERMTVLFKEEHLVVLTSAPDEVVRRGRAHIAMGEGAGVYLPVSELSRLAPAKLVRSEE